MMNKVISKNLLLGMSGTLMLLTGSSALAASGAGMKACEMAVLQKSKFHDLPMAVCVTPAHLIMVSRITPAAITMTTGQRTNMNGKCKKT